MRSCFFSARRACLLPRLALVLLAVSSLSAAALAGWVALRASEADRQAIGIEQDREVAEPLASRPLVNVAARRLLHPARFGDGTAGFSRVLASLPGFQPPPSDAYPDRQEEEAEAPAVAALSSEDAAAAPLPLPRPVEFRTALTAGQGQARLQGAGARQEATPVQRAARAPVAAGAAPDDRSFIQRLFGGSHGPRTVLASAAPDGGMRDLPLSRPLLPTPGVRPGVAVYDISAKTVYMPNGERLEAHSGLGDKLDDPRYVHLRMRGATPPGTYDLKEREALFHGVRAIRMNPVGGSAAIFGRAGILAHNYLLGPSGDSNGCISFKNYDRFLQAYLRGEVRRIVVVAGRYQDGPPASARQRIGMIGHIPGGV